MRICFLPLYSIQRSSSRYRLFQYIEPLTKSGFECTVLPAPELNPVQRVFYIPRLLPLLASHDVLFIQKRMLPSWLLRVVKRINPRIVFDIDDMPMPHFRDSMDEMLQAASVVVAGNKILADYSQRLNDNVRIIPSVVDTQKYKPSVGPRHPGDTRIIIGWIGSDPRGGYLDYLKPVFDWLGTQYGDRIVLRIVSSRPLEMKSKLTIDFQPWSLATGLAALQQFDIGIMPLRDNEVDRGKCGMKLIQYMAVAAGAVASPIGANVDIVQDGETGFLANTLDEWQGRLSQLIEDESLRAQLGQKAAMRVREHYSVTAVLPDLIEALKFAAGSS